MTDPALITPTATTGTPLLRRQWVLDLAIALALMLASGTWATSFWNEWTARGGRGVFYQTYFEPAVMIACGKGFVISHPQPKPLEDFLFERADQFDCKDIPADNPLNTQFLYQGAWRYLLVTVGWAWWLLGISWTTLGPLFGFWFGLAIALAYGVFRIGASRVAAVAAAALLAMSSMQLLNMPHLRDFAKAPFTIALVLILAALIVRPVTRRGVLLLSLAYGIVLGIGYGFRTDFLINLPLLPVLLFVFLGVGIRQRLLLKAAGVVIFLAAFLVASWPITRVVYTSGGCQWHVSLLGLQSPFDDYLRITPAPYDFGHAYSDGYIDRTINGYRWRHSPDAPRLAFCSHEYDVESGQYLSLLVKQFPADFMARAYASALQVLELPFRAVGPPMADWHATTYGVRAELLTPRHRWGLLFGTAAVLIASGASLRFGAALFFLFLYFGGYPAVQFQERHYFHLEFIGWWAIAFVIDRTVSGTASYLAGRPATFVPRRAILRAAVFAALTLAIVVSALVVARRYQSGNARAILQAYVDGPKIPIPAPGAPLEGVAPTAWPQLIEVDLNERACGNSPAVTFNYAADPGGDFKRTVVIPQRAHTEGITRIFQPVYAQFTGIEVSDPAPGCFIGASRASDLSAHPLMLGATLQPEWDRAAPLYQRLKDWERDPDRRQFHPLPTPGSWTVVTGASKSRTWLGLTTVAGDASISGYQATSPVVTAAPGARVTVRVDIRQRDGHVCVGALDAAAASWIAPATATGSEFTFAADDTGGFIVAIANCNAAGNRESSRFTVGRAEYIVEAGPGGGAVRY